MIEFRAGAVWSVQRDFQDGRGERTKYLVLLSDCAEPGTVALGVLATSRGDERYGAQARTQSPCGAPDAPFFRVDEKQEACFQKTTWIEFNNGGPVGRVSLEKIKADKKGEFVQALGEDRIRSLLNCAKKSIDISKRDLASIADALKARVPAKKPEAPKTSIPGAAPTFVSAEILTVRAQIGGYCVGCKAEYVATLGIADGDLTAILHGTKAAAANFVVDASACHELLAERRAGCSDCAKLSAKA